MGYVLADSGLAPWGQAAAIILGLYLFVSIMLGLVLTAALMFGLAWLREKSELIKKLRPAFSRINRSVTAAQKGEPLPLDVADNRFIQTVTLLPKVTATLPAKASAVEQKVEQGSDRVAKAVIEFHARTEMVKAMARTFFLPGLRASRPVVPVQCDVEIEPEQVVTSPEKTEGIVEAPIYEEIVIVQSSR